jgi:putative colanic acid biosynthesis acetyltransferase WcaF
MRPDPNSVAEQFRLDIAANRNAQKWTPREIVCRTLWELLRAPLFAWTPRPFWGWRRTVLRVFGAQIGQNVHIHPTVRIAIPWNLSVDENSALGDGAIVYSLGRISIGRDATVSQYAHLCAGTHDYRRKDMRLLKSPITIEDGAWICADAFIGPGVKIGMFAIVGARAVVTKDVDQNVIVGGNPARELATRPPFGSS